MINQFSIHNLSFGYKRDLILEGINYNFNPREITVILGLNGCGKTTLLKILINVITKYEGEIVLNDKKLNKLGAKEISKYISFVPQLTNGNNDFSVEDYLTFGLVNSIKFYSSPNDEQINKVHHYAKALSLEHLLSKKMNELSGGEKQMIYICGAVIQETPIIILDEPVSALDMKNQYKVLSLLKQLRDDGRTIILTTHNPNIALYLNSKVMVLNNKSILIHGNAKDVINVEDLKEIYGDDIMLSKESSYNELTFK